jgi:hypothetical protein
MPVPVTITQGQSFKDTQGNQGVAQYDPNTGQRLGTGESVTVNPTAAPVPTKAPGVNQPPNQTQAPTPAPVAKPVAIASATAAVNHVNGVIAPAMQQAQSDLASHNAGIASKNAAAAAIAPSPAPQPSTGGSTPQTPAQPATTPSPAATPPTPTAGNRYLYDAQGNQIEMPVDGPIPPGYSATQPAPNPVSQNTPMVSHFMDSQGNTYAQYNNGTYGMTDSNGNYVGAIGAQEFQSAQANSPDAQLQAAQAQVATITQSLAAVANGSYPLTGPQQAQITGLQTQLSADVAAQTAANSNLTGGTTVAMNLYGMGSSIAGLSAIKATVDQGVQKVLDLQTKAASASAAMLDSFQTEDTTALKTAYDVYHGAMTDIQSSIDKMQAQVRQNKVDAQTEAHQQFQDFMTNQNYTLTQKQDAFDNYVKQSQLTETQKTDATDAWYKQQDIALRQQAANPSNGVLGGASPVTVTGSGTPNKAAQAAYLTQFPAMVQTQIKGLADYSLLPTSFPTRAAKGEMDRATAVALAKQYDPTYDENSAAARQAMVKSISTGPNSVTINAANTLVQHLALLKQNASGLAANNGGLAPLIPGLRTATNALQSAVGSPLQGNFNNNLTAVATEAARVYSGGVPTQAEIDEWKKGINVNSTPAQINGYINTVTDLMSGKLSTIAQQYQGTMGNLGGFQVLTDANASLMKKAGIDPSAVDPSYGSSPGAQVSSFYGASASNKQAVDAIMKVAPNATPQDVIDTLAQAGINVTD